MTAAVDRRLEVPATTFPQRYEPVGAQVPPNFLAPLWHTSAGDDAIDLAAACGLELLPWQQLVLRNSLGENPANGRWEAFEVGLIVPRQNGKNVVVMARELAGLFLFGEEQLIHTAHKFKTTKGAFRDIKKVIEKQPELMGMVRSMPDSSDNTAVVLNNGNRLDFMARAAGGGGRGFSGDLVILDEAFKIDETTVSDLLPTLSARPSPQLWYTSSTGFDYSTVLRDVRTRAVEKPDEEKHLAFFEWSADIDSVAWDSVEAVQQSNPSLGYVQDWDWIKAVDLRGMTEEGYKRERLGIWADASTDAAIGVDLWARSFATPEVLIGTKVKRRSLALEVTADRDLSVLAGAAELSDGRVVVDIIAAKPGVAWIQDEVARVVKKHKPYAGVVIDSFSGTAALAPRLSEAGVPVSQASTRDITSGTATVYDALVREDADGDPAPRILHGEHPLLDDAAHTARRRLVGTSKSAWTWQQFGEVRVEPLRAVTLAVRGLEMEPVVKKKRGRVA